MDSTLKTQCKIAIVGAGSIGCYIGGCLASAQVDVTFIGRQRMQQQLQSNGLTLTDWRGRQEYLAPERLNYSLELSALANADFILVTVKSGDTEAIAQDIAQHAKSSAVIVSLQNGVTNGDVLRQHLPSFTVLSGMVPFNVLTKGDGKLHCGTEGNIALEDSNNSAGELIAAFDSARLSVEIYNDLRNIQWTKLLLNLNNAINALSGIPLLEELSDRTYRCILARAISEALTVFKAAGIEPVKSGKVRPKIIPLVLSLPTWLYKIVASSMLKIDPTARSSMYEDFILGRQTEIDYLNGAIVELAKTHHQVSPVNAAIAQLVKENAGKTGSPCLSSIDLEKEIKKLTR